MKKFLLGALALLALWLAPQSASAQGYTVNDQVLVNIGTSIGQVGRPIARAAITVCTITSPVVPCTTGTATLYTDYTEGAMLANPTTSDTNGNYFFTVAPGANYVVTVSTTPQSSVQAAPRTYVITTIAGGGASCPGTAMPTQLFYDNAGACAGTNFIYVTSGLVSPINQDPLLFPAIEAEFENTQTVYGPGEWWIGWINTCEDCWTNYNDGQTQGVFWTDQTQHPETEGFLEEYGPDLTMGAYSNSHGEAILDAHGGIGAIETRPTQLRFVQSTSTFGGSLSTGDSGYGISTVLLLVGSDASGNSVGITAPATIEDTRLPVCLPDTDGTATQFLKNLGAVVNGTNGDMCTSTTWATVTGGTGCSPTGGDTAVQTNHPDGTCYGSADFTWDDTQHNLQAGVTNTVGASATPSFILGTNTTLCTPSGVACSDLSSFGHNNALEGASAHTSDTDTNDLYVTGFANTIANAQDTFILGYSNSVTGDATAVADGLGTVIIAGDGNTIASTTSADNVVFDLAMLMRDNSATVSAGGDLDTSLLAGQNNQVTSTGAGSVTSSVYAVGESNIVHSSGGSDSSNEFMLGEQNTITSSGSADAAVDLAFTLGWENSLSSTNAMDLSNIYILGQNNNAQAVSAASSSVLLLGKALHSLDCTDCFLFGENIGTSTPYTPDDSIGIGVSDVPELQITSGNVSIPGVLTVGSCSGCSTGSTAFSGITSATNTTATMHVGTGATLDATGSGVINATELGSKTFAAPAAIGSGTPAAGTFTTLHATGNITLDAALIDGSASAGTSGFCLTSTGTAVSWANVCGGGSTGISGATAGQFLVAGSATTATSSVAGIGSGDVVRANSATLVTPNLGTPSALVLTNASGLPCTAEPALTGDITSSAGSCATTVAKIAGVTVSGTTGTTNAVFSNGATLVAPVLGTPASVNLANATNLPCAALPALTGAVTGSGCATTYAGALPTTLLGSAGLSGTSPIVTASTGAISCPNCAVSIAHGSQALGTSAILSGACATLVTASASGVVSTDRLTSTFNTDVSGVSGYSGVGTVLTVYPYVATNSVNWHVCNWTASTITPGAATLNWSVERQ